MGLTTVVAIFSVGAAVALGSLYRPAFAWTGGLLLFLLVPVKFIGIYPSAGVVTPTWLLWLTFAMICVLAPRRRSERPDSQSNGVVIAAIVFSASISCSFLLSKWPGTSFGWCLSILGYLWFALIAARVRPDAVRGSRRVFVDVLTIVAIFAVIERLALQANPVWDWAYQNPPHGIRPIGQLAGSVYRSTTTFGHPLVNSTVFSVGLCLTLGDVISYRRRRGLPRLVLFVAAIASTGSRTGLFAAGAGSLFTVFSSLRPGLSGRRRRLAILVFAIGGLAILPLAIAGRSGDDLSRSDRYRSAARTSGLAIARASPPLGSGPGTASKTWAERSGQSALPIENSYLELWIASGAIGLVAFLGLLGAMGRRAWLNRDAGLVGALTAYSTAIGGFNLLEGTYPAHVLLGLFLALSIVTPVKYSRNERRRSGVRLALRASE